MQLTTPAAETPLGEGAASAALEPQLAEPTVVCTGCREDLPATPEFFWRSKGTPNGLWRRCKACCMETPGLVRRTAERAKLKAERQAAKRGAPGKTAPIPKEPCCESGLDSRESRESLI